MKLCMIGNSGHGMSILPELDRRPELRLTGFCKSYPEEPCTAFFEEILTRRRMKVNCYESYTELLDREQPELVVIDGMFCDHADMAVQALDHGIHVYMDKPVATTVQDLTRLSAAVEKSSARLFAMLTMRYEPCFYTVHQLVREGAVGELRMMNGQKSYRLGKRPPFFANREQFGGLIPWVAIHMIDLMLWISGKKCLSLDAMQNNFHNHGYGDLEMLSLCNLELEDHVLAGVSADYYRPAASPTHGDDRLRIVGTEGVLEVADSRITLIDQEGWRTVSPLPAPDLFADCLDRIAREDYSEDTDGIQSTLLCLLARQSADESTRMVV